MVDQLKEGDEILVVKKVDGANTVVSFEPTSSGWKRS
ncbi:MAG: hypothetical protein H6Q81_1729 [Deltaproteobacteria bacterium]|nr:hypothetical protein [Deltaproteobacteria bacterium]